MNPEFQESTTQVADALDLDELHSARLLLESQEDAESLNKPNVASAIIYFHECRYYLLECLRLLLKQSIDLVFDEVVRDISGQLIRLILETKDGPARNGSLYTQKCFGAMAEIEKALQVLGDRHQGVMALGQTSTPEYDEIFEFLRLSLGQQHESVGAIVNQLIRANHTGIEDFYKLLELLPNLDKWNSITVHYVPIITAFAFQYGSPEGGGVLREARLLNSKLIDGKDVTPWTLPHLQAATIAWWLAEYSGWYIEQPTGSPVQGANLEAEAKSRSEAFFKALREGAFQCTLSVCSHATPDEWCDLTKNELIEFLLRDTLPLPNESVPIAPYFQRLIMEQLEAFVDAFITNMPDILRRFKFEDDDQRKRIRSGLLVGAPSVMSEQSLHLERFLLIISFAFDHRVDAAQSFWNDTDGNLYGFLQWASKRQSTPNVGAFCEMFRSISEGEDCATSAHRFLLEENNLASGKLRRSSSLSWAQIFGELNVYTSKVREQPMVNRSVTQYGGKSGPDEIDEPESALMLGTYLRLTAYLCGQSSEIRSWILYESGFAILEVLFYLCNGTVPSRLQACAFNVVRGLLADKSVDLGMSVWTSLDQWVSGHFSPPPNIPRPPKVTSPAAWAIDVTFEAIAADFEQAHEFISLLLSLVCPAAQDTGLNDHLPFPETLGSSYRMPGVDPYIDFVFGKMLASKMPHTEFSLQDNVLLCDVLSFAVVCLDSFNEDLVVLANRSTIPMDEAMNTSSLTAYIRLHPFSRVMEWMFNDGVLTALFASAHRPIAEVSNASADSPLIAALIRNLEVMNLIMDLQSTFLDIVRPLIKSQSTGRWQPVLDPTLASFEDSVSVNLGLIIDLGLYSGIGNESLAVTSLKLLEKIVGSPKFNARSAPGLSERLQSNRLISIVEQHDDMERIAGSLALAMNFDSRELCLSSLSPGYTIKTVILDFINHCLSASPDRPTLAHALLGFSCKNTTLDVEAGSPFANGSSLFHTILHLVVEYPDGDGDSIQAWSMNIKQKGMQVLSTLWTSTLTSIFTLTELRTSDFLFALFLRQFPVKPGLLWDGRSVGDSDFMYTESAESLEHWFWQRCWLLEYSSTETRLVALEGIPSLKARILSTLLGTTSLPDGDNVPNLTIFDLLDFIEQDVSNKLPAPELRYFTGLDFSISAGHGYQKPTNFYDIKVIEEMISLRSNEMRKAGRFQDPNQEQAADAEAQRILLYFQSENSQFGLASAKSRTTKAWADLLTLAISTSDLDQGGKAALILQALQLITPKLEEYALEQVREAVDIANLILALLFQLDFGSTVLERSRAGDVANDRLFQVFRTALRAVNGPSMQLREVLYKISYRYLAGMAQIFSDIPARRRQATQTVKTTGEKTMDMICDDAYGASVPCRICALLLLNALGNLAKLEMSNYVIDSLVRTNFMQLLVESIESIPRELRQTNAKGKQSQNTIFSNAGANG